MVAPSLMIALDTNLLVYAHRAGTAEHVAAKEAILRAVQQGMGWGIPAPCLAEFWAVVTHSSCPGGPSDPAQATLYINQLLDDGGGQVWSGGPGFGHRLLQKAVELKVSGPRIFDLQIALTAYENGAGQLWTNDKQFIALPGLKIVNPIESSSTASPPNCS